MVGYLLKVTTTDPSPYGQPIITPNLHALSVGVPHCYHRCTLLIWVHRTASKGVWEIVGSQL